MPTRQHHDHITPGGGQRNAPFPIGPPATKRTLHERILNGEARGILDQKGSGPPALDPQDAHVLDGLFLVHIMEEVLASS
ncbi:MAG: hypothetical protein KDB61_09440, partial [Planctomycetes bacterium]|nr:hypothetical protein [Planctomycetota bacterium]